MSMLGFSRDPKYTSEGLACSQRSHLKVQTPLTGSWKEWAILSLFFFFFSSSWVNKTKTLTANKETTSHSEITCDFFNQLRTQFRSTRRLFLTSPHNVLSCPASPEITEVAYVWFKHVCHKEKQCHSHVMSAQRLVGGRREKIRDSTSSFSSSNIQVHITP